MLLKIEGMTPIQVEGWAMQTPFCTDRYVEAEGPNGEHFNITKYGEIEVEPSPGEEGYNGYARIRTIPVTIMQKALEMWNAWQPWEP